MASKKDYYDTLGVEKNSDFEKIKKAYRKKAMKYHPDRNPDSKTAEAKFKEATEAYEVLSDDSKRQVYDQYGHAGLEGAAGSGFHGFRSGEDINEARSAFESFFGGGGMGGLGSIFEEMLGGGGGRSQRSAAARGSDLGYELRLSFNEAAFGTKKQIEIPRTDTCKTCKGSGAAAGSQPTPCIQCGGSGQMSRSQGFFSIRTTCDRCHGQGIIITNPCKACAGHGRVKVRKKISVNIPAGVDTGSRLKISGEGEAGIKGGPAGNLYVIMEVENHPLFDRHGDDILCEIPIHFTIAALGGQIEVPALKGKAKLKIPAGTQTGTIFRLKGKGIANLRGYGNGDEHIRIIVEIPEKLTKEQKNLLEKFDKENTDRQNPKTTEFREKVNEYYEK